MAKSNIRIIKTLSALFLGAGQEFVFQVLSAVIWIKFWGVEIYSEWLLVSLLPMLILRGNVGIFHSATSKLIKQFSNDSFDDASKTYSSLYQSQNFLLLGVGGVYAVAAIVVAFLIKPSSFNGYESSIIFIAYFFQFYLFQWQQSILSVAKADGRAPQAVMWQNYFRLIGIVFLLLPALYTGPINCLVMAVMSQLIIVLATRNCFVKSTEKVVKSRSNICRREVVYLLRKGVQFSLFPLGQTAIHTFSTWGLGFFLGPVAAAGYHNMRTIARGVVIISRAAEQAVRFELAELFARRQFLEARALIAKAVLYASLLCCCVVIFALFVGQHVFEIITHGELDFKFMVFLVLCVGAILFSISQIYLSVPFSMNEHGPISKKYLIIVAITLTSCLLVSKFGGELGISITILISEILFLFFVRKESTRLAAL